MNKQLRISILLCLLILLSLPQIVLSQEERLAVVSTFEGQIKIQHGGVWKTVTKIGNRMKNSSVYSDDTVLTMPGSTAVLIFNDNSRLEVKESTTMTIFEKLITDKVAQQGYVTNVSGVQEKEKVRNIKLKTGGLWASITPSKSVLTEFETPTGVASVRGTELSVDYDEATGIAAIDLGEGNIVYVSPGEDITFDMGGGDVVRVAVPESGSGVGVVLNVVSGDIEVNALTGDVVNMNTGDGVEVISTDTGDTSVTVTATGDDGEVTVDTDAGTVEMTTGDAVEVGTTDDGNTSVVVTATGEDGGVTLETDEGTVTIADDASLVVAIDPDTGEMTVAETSGEITITTEDGTTTNVEVGDGIGTAPPEGNIGDDIAAAIEAGASPGALGTPVDADGGGDDVENNGGGDLWEGGDPDAVIPPSTPNTPNGTGGPQGLPPLPTIIDNGTANNPPVAVSMDVATNEDNSYTITLTATDADGDDLTSNSFAIVGAPENGTLSEITVKDRTTVEVTYTPDADMNGPDSFTFKVDDGTDSSNTATVNIDINSVNDMPSFDMEGDQQVDEDAPEQDTKVSNWALNISPGATNEAGQELTFNVTNDNNALFSVQPSIDPVTGELSYTLANSTPGTAEIIVSLQDDGGMSNDGNNSSQEQAFTITVNDILNKGSEAMELLNYYGIGGVSIPEDPSSFVIGNDFFPDIDISPAGYIHGGSENIDGSEEADGLIVSIINDGDNNDDDGIIWSDGFGVSFNEAGDSTDHVATFRDVDETFDDEGQNIEQNDTKGTSFYSRATDKSVVTNTSFGDLLISHDYRLTDDGNVLVADVTVTNTGNNTLSNLKYRRKVDFDIADEDPIEEGPIDDFIVPSIDPDDTLIEYVAAPHVDNASTNPLSSDTTNSVPGATYTADNAAVIQLDLGTLAPNESITFPVFFAGDDSSANLQASIDRAVSTTYIKVSDPSETNAVFALGSGTSNLSTPTGVRAVDKDHFKLLIDSMSILIGHLSKESYSSHAETIVSGLNNPTGIAVHDGVLFVTDDGVNNDDRVLRIEESDNLESGNWAVDEIVSIGSGLNNPTDIVTDKEGNLLITGYGDSNDAGVFRVVDSGTDAGWEVDQITYSGSGLNNPTGIAVDHGNDLNNIFDDTLYVTDDGADKVFQLVYGEGWEVIEVASEGSTGARIDEPQGVAVLSGGELRVVDTGSDSVLKVDPWVGYDGYGDTFRLATERSTKGEIDEPVDIVVDDDGFLYVVDSHNNSINKVFHGSIEGERFIASSETTDEIGNPVGIAIDNNGTSSDTSDDIIYIIDDEKKSVVKLTKTTNDKTLLAFAKKLRADLKTHDAGFHDSAESVNLDSIISKLQQNVDSPNTVSNTEIISDLETVRDDLMVHAGLESIFDHVDLTHLIGDSIDMITHDQGVQLNLDVIEANVDKAKAYLQAHINEESSSTELDNIMTQINGIKTDIDSVRSNSNNWTAADGVEDGLEEVFESLVDHISPNNNPFAFLKNFSNEDAVDMMLDNGIGGAFIPSLAINTVNKIDNGTLEVGISQDGSLVEPTRDVSGLKIDGFINNDSKGGNVIFDEGYGVSYDVTDTSSVTKNYVAGIGTIDTGDSSTYDTTIYTKGSQYNRETFTHKVGVDRTDSTVKGDLDITHKFKLEPPDLHIGAEGFGWEKMMAVTVTMTNTGTDPIANLKYRRLANFDSGDPSVSSDSKFTVPTTDGINSGDATLEAVGAPAYYSDPDLDPTTNYDNSSSGTYTGDLEALIQFDLDTLAPGERKTFQFFYAADKSSNMLSGNIDNLVTDAKYVSSTRDGSQPYHAFALGTGSSNGIGEVDNTSTESQHFNILSDTLSLMLRNLALDTASTYTTSTVASGGNIQHPVQMVFDSSGSIFVSDKGSDAILKIDPSNGTTTVVASELSTGGIIDEPAGIKIDSDGNLIVADSTDASSEGAILKINPTTGATTVITDETIDSDVDVPFGLIIGSSDGSIYTADQGFGGDIVKTVPSTGIATVVASNASISIPVGIDFSQDENFIYVADIGTDSILKVHKSDGTTTTIVSESTSGGIISEPIGVAVTAEGLLVVGDREKNTIFKIDPVSGDMRVIANNFSSGGKIDEPRGIALDSTGDIFVANNGSDSIVKIEQSTSTNFLLAFARKIRGDMEVHDDEHTDAVGETVVQDAHQTFMDTIDDVIDDIDTNISNPNSVGKMDIFAELKAARNLLMDGHADMKEPVQHTDLAHILLDSKRLADDQVRLNLASIHEAIKQVKIFMAEHINDFGNTTVHRGIEFQIANLLAKIGSLKDDIYLDTAAVAIQNGLKESFCDVIDHMVHSDSGAHGENPFDSCHHDEG